MSETQRFPEATQKVSVHLYGRPTNGLTQSAFNVLGVCVRPNVKPCAYGLSVVDTYFGIVSKIDGTCITCKSNPGNRNDCIFVHTPRKTSAIVSALRISKRVTDGFFNRST